jgi:hypothetical protein
MNSSTTANQRKGITVTDAEHSPKAPRNTGIFAALRALFRGKGSGASKIVPIRALGPIAALVTLAALPAGASAYATIEGPPVYSAAPGLPDGRFYEQVSPGDKFGNQAGASTTLVDSGAKGEYGIASADGNAVLFEGTGAMGETPSGNNRWFVATKKTGEPGWSTRSLLPAEPPGVLGNGLNKLDISPDLSHAMVVTNDLLSGRQCPDLFLTGPDPFAPAEWLARPEIEDPVSPGGCDSERATAVPVGGTPDFSTVYFAYSGTLLAEDAERAPYAGGQEAWGFYEEQEGVLREAGVLPDGKLDRFGAVPAASGHGHDTRGNQVSADGSRAFFVSPDPGSCEAGGGRDDCATDPPELYVRESEGAGAQHRSVLVSQDNLLPDDGGLPASAPGGVLAMPNPTYDEGEDLGKAFQSAYVFASPDGSQAFFQSASALTQAAEEASPGSGPKTYDFDVDTGALTYLPGVVPGEILASDSDGSAFAFVHPATGGEPAQLELWSAGANGGSVTNVVQLPEPGASVPEARLSSDGSVLVFQTSSQLSGSFNSVGFQQIYRYSVPANTIGCVSCAPAGVAPAFASMSHLSFEEAFEEGKVNITPEGPEGVPGMVDERGISSNGSRVFFETYTPLVPQDSNTNSPPVRCHELDSCIQGIDVYEWENGVVYLISTGRSPRDAFLLDSSENGDDVFIATSEGLLPGDTDGGYDVYDARVPHPGEPFPPSAVPCEGAVCQGPPNVPSPLTPPASATFSGLGNPPPEVAAPAEAKKSVPKAVKCASRRRLSHGKCVRVKRKSKAVKQGKARRARNDRRVKS